MNNRVNNGAGMNSGRGMDSPARYQMSRPQMESVGGRSMAQPASRGYSRPPLEMRQPIVMPRGGEGRGNAPRMSAPSHGGGAVAEAEIVAVVAAVRTAAARTAAEAGARALISV